MTAPADFQAFMDQNPPPQHFDSQYLSQRQSKYQLVYNSMLHTEPPPSQPSDLVEYVPTSIEKAGPGNYGTKQLDEGNEIVLLNDEILASVPNATLVLIDGNELERISVLFQFPQFLEHCPNECVNIMVPRICTDSLFWTLETQDAATEALFFVVNRTVPQHIAKRIAWVSLALASKTDSSQIFDACAELVSTVLPQMHRYDVLNLVAPDTIDRALSSRDRDRRLAARVIGSFNSALTREEVQTIFEDTALNLAQDEDPTVRTLVAQSIAEVASYLPISTAEKRIWPLLKMLMSDDKVATVRASAMRSLAKSAQAHCGVESASPLYEALLKPVFFNQCRAAVRVAAADLRDVDDDTYIMLEVFSEVYGCFLCSVSQLLNHEKESWVMILNTLRQMVTCNGPTVRHWCAFNMPAVVSVCTVEKLDQLGGILPALAADSDVETRITLAAGIHVIAKKLAHGPLRNDVIRAVNFLFMDENADVRMKVLAHFSELLILLSPGEKANHDMAKAQIRASDASQPEETKSSNRDNFETRHAPARSSYEEMRRLKPMFTSLEMMSFDSWRTQKLLAEELQKAANLIPQDMLCEHVAPLLFQMARESTFTVRKSAMRALIFTIRYIPDVRRRNHILKHFRNEWARGKVYWTRLAYIEAAKCAREMFSTRLFTQLFKDEILPMHADVVPNVRLRLTQFLGYVAPIWKDVPDFVESLAKLADDSDVEVSREAQMLIKKLPSIKAPSAVEMEKDKALEAAESGFYVHRARKKRKVQTRSDNEQGTSRQTKSGKVRLPAVQNDNRRESPRSHRSNPTSQKAKQGRDSSTPLATSGKGIPAPTATTLAAGKVSNGLKASIGENSGTSATKNVGLKEGLAEDKKTKGSSNESSHAGAGQGQVRPKKKGFFAKLFSSCFGR